MTDNSIILTVEQRSNILEALWGDKCSVRVSERIWYDSSPFFGTGQYMCHLSGEDTVQYELTTVGNYVANLLEELDGLKEDIREYRDKL